MKRDETRKILYCVSFYLKDDINLKLFSPEKSELYTVNGPGQFFFSRERGYKYPIAPVNLAAGMNFLFMIFFTLETLNGFYN